MVFLLNEVRQFEEHKHLGFLAKFLLNAKTMDDGHATHPFVALVRLFCSCDDLHGSLQIEVRKVAAHDFPAAYLQES